MTDRDEPQRILLVTGMSGAGKSTALRTFEDMGWETVDNLPLSLFDQLLESPRSLDRQAADRSIAIGIDSRTRGFDAGAIVERIKTLESDHDFRIETLFLDCNAAELERRFSETRRRHPQAQDRPAAQGILIERDMMMPLRRWAEHVIDTSDSSANDLRVELRNRFSRQAGQEMTVTIASFGFARGILRNADMVFDMRFLRNPHWDETLRPMTGKDEAVGDYIAEDPAYEDAVGRMEELLVTLLPRYRAEGKAYVTIAFGCTGGRHRSVHVAERVAQRLRDSGFSPTVAHRDLAHPSLDTIERTAGDGNGNAGG
ncbi:RNase adapter RapZ [uncultured Parasphingopyxis sp.]|uniref:RNase adapter RapZ n=1 Tax=uncultured Parasphingopyxis sp. TaxID=1547918 RepID=UPI002630E373|nr:RNase adapter RapZ [uncultured Parasphingopyxis sp.]